MVIPRLLKNSLYNMFGLMLLCFFLFLLETIIIHVESDNVYYFFEKVMYSTAIFYVLSIYLSYFRSINKKRSDGLKYYVMHILLLSLSLFFFAVISFGYILLLYYKIHLIVLILMYFFPFILILLSLRKYPVVFYLVWFGNNSALLAFSIIVPIAQSGEL